MYPTLVQANDIELEHRILNFLRSRGVGGLDSVRVEVAGGVATISGRQPSEQDHELCLECCRHVAGVVRIIDESETR